MSETKWTPGPWEWQEIMPEDKDWGMCEITASDDDFVCTAVIGVDNARLISAAPDMAEALERVIRFMEHDDPWGRDYVAECHELVSAARSALAKARGET